MLQYLQNILYKYALRFYLNIAKPYATTYQQAINMIEQEYTSKVWQTKVKDYLHSLRVSEFVEQSMKMSASLSKVYKFIMKLSYQVPVLHCGDAHKIKFLHRATVGYQWTHEPLSRVATTQTSFPNLYTKLNAALQLDKKGKIQLIKDKAHKPIRETQEETGVNYVGLGCYG